MQLSYDDDVEAFRAEFVAFLEANLPDEAEATERSTSSADVPEWARRWQRLQFDNGWLLPGNPPEFGGRNATLIQQAVHLEELSKRRIYHSSILRASASSRRPSSPSEPRNRSRTGPRASFAQRSPRPSA